MAKTSHVGKSSRDKQSYFDVVAHVPGDSTVQDDFLEPTSAESKVPEEPDKRIIKKPSQRARRKSKGLNAHLQKNLASYVIGILSGILVIITGVGFKISGDAERMSSQIQTQKEATTRLEGIISNLQSVLRDYIIQIQEQALRIQFLEKAIQKPNP